MLIYVQHYKAFEEGRVPEPTPTYVAGFKQWLSLDRHVMKGQTGYAILAPVTARFASSTPENAESWRRLARGEEPNPPSVTRGVGDRARRRCRRIAAAVPGCVRGGVGCLTRRCVGGDVARRAAIARVRQRILHHLAQPENERTSAGQ